MIAESTFIPTSEIGVVVDAEPTDSSRSMLLDTIQSYKLMVHPDSREIPLPKPDGKVVERDYNSTVRECLPLKISFYCTIGPDTLSLLTDFFSSVDPNKICARFVEKDSSNQQYFITINSELDQFEAVQKLLSTVAEDDASLTESLKHLKLENNPNLELYRNIADRALSKLAELKSTLSEEEFIRRIRNHEFSHITRSDLQRVQNSTKITDIEDDELFNILLTRKSEINRLDEAISIFHELSELTTNENSVTNEAKYFFFHRMTTLFFGLSQQSIFLPIVDAPSATADKDPLVELLSGESPGSTDFHDLAWLQIVLGSPLSPVEMAYTESKDAIKNRILQKINFFLEKPDEIQSLLKPESYDQLFSALTRNVEEFSQIVDSNA